MTIEFKVMEFSGISYGLFGLTHSDQFHLSRLLLTGLDETDPLMQSTFVVSGPRNHRLKKLGSNPGRSSVRILKVKVPEF